MKLFIDANLLVYLLTKTPGEAEKLVEFYVDLVYNHALYTNPLVLDETIHVSRRKYNALYETSFSSWTKKSYPM